MNDPREEARKNLIINCIISVVLSVLTVLAVYKLMGVY